MNKTPLRDHAKSDAFIPASLTGTTIFCQQACTFFSKRLSSPLEVVHLAHFLQPDGSSVLAWINHALGMMTTHELTSPRASRFPFAFLFASSHSAPSPDTIFPVFSVECSACWTSHPPSHRKCTCLRSCCEDNPSTRGQMPAPATRTNEKLT